MRRVRRVEIVRETRGWKGTWYRTGQRYFVVESQNRVLVARWTALGKRPWGILEDHARVLTGWRTWLACAAMAVWVAVAGRWHWGYRHALHMTSPIDDEVAA